MATCKHCGTMILFGGVRANGLRFCSAKCRDAAPWLTREDLRLPAELIEEQARRIHQSSCPKCGRSGPIDVHDRHQAFSFLVFTQYKSTRTLCCRRCATKGQLASMLYTFVAGWWSLPGLLITPAQLFRNAQAMLGGPDNRFPSERLTDMARQLLAQNDGEFVTDQPSGFPTGQPAQTDPFNPSPR